MRRTLIPVVLLVVAAPSFAQSTKLPSDLALVPEDGIGLVHVRVAELWNHESVKDVRDIVRKAGDKAIAALDERFASLPSSVERLTLWVGPTRKRDQIDSDIVFVVRLSRPADRAKLVQLLVPDATERKGKRFAWFADVFGASLLIADDRTFVLGPKSQIARLADGVRASSNWLRDSIEVAAGDRPMTIGLVPSALPADWQSVVMREIPAAIHPMLVVQSATASLDLVGEGHLHLRLHYPTTTGAEAAERMLKSPEGPVRKLIGTTRKELEELAFADKKEMGLSQVPFAVAAVMGLGMLKQTEEVLASDRVRRNGRAIDAALELPSRSKTIAVPAALAVGAGVGAFAANWRKDLQGRMTNDMKMLLLGLHNYNDVFGEIAPAIRDPDGKPLLSWRVALLPFIEQDNMYKAMKIDEPWDSEHNKKFIDKMPKIFAIDGVPAKKGYTHYRTFVGAKAPWAFDRPTTIQGIAGADGASNTILLVQAADPVIWTKPDELPADGKQAIKSRLLFREGRTIVGLADGSVRILRDTVDEKIWKMLVDPNDGEPIPWDKLK